MKTRLSLFLSLVVSAVLLNAQNSATYDYFSNGIEELVAAAGDTGDVQEEEKTNHVYSRMFTSPVLYESVLRKAFSCNDEESEACSEMLAMDEKRSSVIDRLLLNVYRTHPEKIAMMEEELRKENTYSGVDNSGEKPLLSLKNSSVYIPENVAGDMKTTVVKPNYWKFAGRSSLTFSQNFLSPNWFQGGENYYAMLATVDIDLNYDDKDRITFTNHFDLDLGFATAQADTVHQFKTNTDKLRIESTFGYKVVKNLDIAAKLKLESQMLPYYAPNRTDFSSASLAPFDANASIGLNYKPSLGNFRLEIYLAPLSAYNFRYVHYERLASSLGISADNRFKVGRGWARHDFGTQLVVTMPTYKLASFLDVWSRLEYYTNYHRAFFQWEAKFDFTLNRYFTASVMVHSRFDDSVISNEDYGFWQLKELFTLGVAYSW